MCCRSGLSSQRLGCTLAAITPNHRLFAGALVRWCAGALVVIGVAALSFTNATNTLMQLSTEPAPIAGWIADHPCPRCPLCIGAASSFAAAAVAAYARAQQVHRSPQQIRRDFPPTRDGMSRAADNPAR